MLAALDDVPSPVHADGEPVVTRMPGQRLEDHPDYAYVEQCRRLAFWLDGAFALPGTNYRFGLDGLIGLIPGFGDALTMLISLRVMALAKEAGLPPMKILQMAINTGLDWGIGSIPMIGDLFDFFFKSNRRNLALLEAEILKRIEEEQRR